MQIKIIVVGKLKEKYWRDAADEYIKRLGPFAKIDIHEIAE
jgi:23S rRNA (pseudouridine1915-N3)-methyltransferase